MFKIGLALGGGGAKGFAHIGVLRGLEELDIRPDIVTGASMGGIIAGMYAAGLAVDRIESIVRRTSLGVMASIERNNLGLFGKTKLRRVMEDVLGDTTFDQLPRRLAVVAVDLESGCEVVLDSGPVVDALLATSSFPGVFAPEIREGRYLIDGGALNNVPFDVTRRMKADYVIASNVLSHCPPLFQPPPELSPGPELLVKKFLFRTGAAPVWEVVDRTITIMQNQCLKEKLAECPPDIMLCPDCGQVGLFELYQLDSCLTAGLDAVRAKAAELAALRIAAEGPQPQVEEPPLESMWTRLLRLIRR